MDRYEKIKQQLIDSGVRMKGFGSWLNIRQEMDNAGLNNFYNPQETFGLMPYEIKWERAYRRLKKDVNVKFFADWLNGVTPQKQGVFVQLGQVLTQFGRRLIFLK